MSNKKKLLTEEECQKHKTFFELAKSCESSERYEDMFSYVEKMIEIKPKLTIEERNLFSVANKNIYHSKKYLIYYPTPSNEIEKFLYEQKVFKKLQKHLMNTISILDEKLIPNVFEKDFEGQVFFWKLKADCYRYICGLLSESCTKGITDTCKSCYEEAFEISKNLNFCNPIRLGLALNFGVFYYENMNEKEKAKDLAKSTFDNGMTELYSLSEEDYKDSSMILQLLRDNLELWQ